jgi:hypothetical protein
VKEFDMSEMVKLDAGMNWTGLDEVPFEVIAERELELEHEGQKGPLLVSFGKPTYIDGKGWCCVFKLESMGRVHVTPAGGADSVHAIQMAMHMVHTQLSGMARAHKITFLGESDWGFGRVGGVEAGSAAAAKCPVVGMSVGS